MGHHVAGRIRSVLEKLRVELTIPVDHLVAWIGKQRKIGRPALLYALTLHHFFCAFNIVRAKCENLRRLFQLVIEKVFQLTQLGCAGTSPIAAIHDEDDVLTPVLR